MKKLILIFVLCSINLYHIFAQVPTNCQNTVTLNTGYNHSTNASYTVGAWDNYWKVITGPSSNSCGVYTYPSPANVITPSWGATNLYTNTQWLSFRPTASLNCNNTCASGIQPVVFERKFCMVKPDTVIIDVFMRFDNAACLFVDGTATGTLGTNVPLTPFSVVANANTTYATIGPVTNTCPSCDQWNDTKTFDGNHDARSNKFKIYLTAGTHNIQMRVRNNSAVLFGAMLSGTIKSVSQQNNFLCPNNCQLDNGSIAIQKVLDNNCNGKQDTGESLGTGWSYTVTGANGFSQTVTTDGSGYAFLNGLVAGTYTVIEVVQSGWTTSTPIQTANVNGSQTPVLTFYNCPKPCIDFAQTTAVCSQIINGVQTYTISGLISNGNSISFPFNPTVGSGTITNVSTTTVAANAANQSFSFVYTPGATNPCFIIKFVNPNGILICAKEFCITLPSCKCLELAYTLKCNPSVTPNTPQPYVYMVTITNPTSSTISIPMSSSTGALSPLSINAAPGTNVYNVYYTPNAGTTKACILFGVGIVPLPIPICKSPIECIPLPDCCLDANGKLECGLIINQRQTYTFTGSLTNYSATTATTTITSNVSGTISGLTPPTISANASTLTSFVFTPTGAMPSNICFYFAPSKVSKICDSVCISVPDCPKPCIDVTKLDAKCETINGVNTIVVTGMLNTSTSVITSLNINPAVTITSGGTIPAGAVGHNFSFQYVPSAYAPSYCFVFSPSHPVIDYKLCKDTFCIKNPCPPVVTGNKCCPKTMMKACCITTNEIKYEFTAAAVPTSICGMIVTVMPSTFVTAGNAFYPGGPKSVVINGYTSFTPPVGGVPAGATLTYYLTIPTANPLSTVTIKYITCGKDTCDVEKFTIGKKSILDATDVTLTSEVIKDTLFAKAFKLDFSKVKNKGKVKSISIIPNDLVAGQDVFFAITGAEQFSNENQALIPLWEARQGLNSATFFFKEALNIENYKGQVLNIVTKRRVKGFNVLMFDEEGLLISSSTVAGASPTTVVVKDLKSNFSSLSIAPNPAIETVNLSFTLDMAQKISVDLYDISGKWLKNIDSAYHPANQSQPLEFNVSEFQSGLYFVRLTNESGQIFTQKLSILH